MSLRDTLIRNVNERKCGDAHARRATPAVYRFEAR